MPQRPGGERKTSQNKTKNGRIDGLHRNNKGELYLIEKKYEKKTQKKTPMRMYGVYTYLIRVDGVHRNKKGEPRVIETGNI